MKLTSIKFLNFRKFRQETLELTGSFNTIFGLNGSGKTSITDAIGYALFGSRGNDFTRVSAKGDLVSYFVRDSEGNSDFPSKIELNLEIAGESYRLVRVINKGLKKHENDFIPEKEDSLFGPNLELVGPGEVTAYVEKNLLGVDREIFLRSVFAKQKDLLVLSGNARDRKKIINSILGIDMIEELVTSVSDEARDKKRELKIKKGDAANFSLEEVENSKKELETAKKEEEKKQKETEKIIKNMSADFEKIKSDFQALQNQKDLTIKTINNLSLITQKQEKLKIDKEENTKKLAYLQEKETYFLKNTQVFETEKKLLQEFSEAQKQEVLFARKTSLEKDINQITENLENIKKTILEFAGKDFDKQEKDNETNLKNFQKDITDLSQNLGQFSSDLTRLKTEAEEIKKEKENIASLGENADCPTCKRKLESQYSFLLNSFEKLLEEKRNKWKSISEEKQKTENILSSQKDEIVKLEKEIFEFKQSKEKFTKLQSEQDKLEENLAKLQGEFAPLKDVIFDMESYIKLQNELEKISKQSNELKNLEGEIKLIPEIKSKLENLEIEEKNLINLATDETKNLEKIDFKEEVYLEKKKSYDEFYLGFNKKQEELNEINKAIFEFDKKIQVFVNQIENYNKTVKSVENLIEDLAYLEVKKQVLKDYSSYLFSYLKPRLEDIASEYFSTMTDFKYSRIEIDSEYNIKIDSRILDLYSGGEQDLANLCLRLALGQNIGLTNTKNHINFLVLDEVLGSQDSTRQNNILIGLKKLEHKFSQILLISHLESVKDFSTKLIEVKAISKDESEIVEY
ncbi:MAG: SMC family ATPase [Candidatus Gracilibacteria bacterium]|nr:SMC family ATPase [Candidatus Gracilibacteria bacterium]